jgi:hypothetical protein
VSTELLIPAISSYIRSKGGAPTKTKVLKLIYLLDVEFFREKHETLSGFEWIFYKFGPWTAQYDEVLEQLSMADKVRLNPPAAGDSEPTFVDPTNPVELSSVFPNFQDELKARRIVEVWADRPTVELLDYVYFHTAPMRTAERNHLLDFDTILQEEPPTDYRRDTSSLTPDELKKARKRFLSALSSAPKVASGAFIEPAYGPEYWDAIETMEREPD